MKTLKTMGQKLITYPVAYNQFENSIVPIEEAKKEFAYKYSCPLCGNRFSAVLDHPTPHFRHFSGYNCSGSKETYLHWLTKEIFKELKEIELPELLIEKLPEKPRQKFQTMYNEIVYKNIPETLRKVFRESLKKELTNIKKITISNVQSEQRHQTSLGNIVVDLTMNYENKDLFIEPYFSNKISAEKRKKIALLNKHTISIDLQSFSNYYEQNFCIDYFRDYLISGYSKNWEHLSNEEYDNIIKDYNEYLMNEILDFLPIIKTHNSKLERIDALEKNIQDKRDKIHILNHEITNLNAEISVLKEELGMGY